MNNYQFSQKEAIKGQYIDPLAIFFFFLGALHVYSALKRKSRQRQEEYENRFRWKSITTFSNYGSVALFALIVAVMMEIYLF